MGCTGYRNQACECEKPHIFNKAREVRTADSGNPAYPHVLCRRCDCITDAVLHVDAGLDAPKGYSGHYVYNEDGEAIGISGSRGPS